MNQGRDAIGLRACHRQQVWICAEYMQCEQYGIHFDECGKWTGCNCVQFMGTKCV